MSYNDTNEVADELYESLRSRYQGNLETSMRGSDFVFDSVQRMYCKCHKVNFRHGVSYIGSSDWMKKKKATNPKNEDDSNIDICIEEAKAIFSCVIGSRRKGKSRKRTEREQIKSVF